MNNDLLDFFRQRINRLDIRVDEIDLFLYSHPYLKTTHSCQFYHFKRQIKLFLKQVSEDKKTFLINWNLLEENFDDLKKLRNANKKKVKGNEKN